MINIPKINVADYKPNKIIQNNLSPATIACNGKIIEPRYPKVITDENKLFGTNETHKYY